MGPEGLGFEQYVVYAMMCFMEEKLEQGIRKINAVESKRYLAENFNIIEPIEEGDEDKYYIITDLFVEQHKGRIEEYRRIINKTFS